MEIYFLPAILLLGLITSYQDIKIGKIRNKWVIAGLLYAFVVYSILISYNLFYGILNQNYILELLTNFIFAICVGFGFWYYGLWTAGDGKLFIAFVALIPLSLYSVGYQKWIPSLTLLLNILIIGLLITIIMLILKIKIKHFKLYIKEFSFLEVVIAFLGLYSVSWITELFNLDPFTTTFLIIGLFAFVDHIIKENGKYIYPIIALLRIYLQGIPDIKSLLITFILWKIIFGFFNGPGSKITSDIFGKIVKSNKLKPGMVLLDVIEEIKSKKKGSIKKGNIYYIKKERNILNKDIIDYEPEGLTKEQVKILKSIGFKEYNISQTMSFAPIIFIGTLLTYLVKGNILIYIKNLF